MSRHDDSYRNIGLNTLLVDIATRNVICLTPDDSVGEAAHIMAEKRISSIVVADEHGHPIGIVTERNLLHAMQAGCPPETLLSEEMTSPLITVPANITCLDAYQQCQREGIRHLVIVDADRRLLGLVSETDFRQHIDLTVLAGHRQVATVMNRSVFNLPPETSLMEALSLMHSHRDTCVVVVEDKRPIGIVTERDIVRLYDRDPTRTAMPLREIMTSPVQTIALDNNVSGAANLMLSSKIRQLVVVDDGGRMAGLLSEHDLTQNLAYSMVDSKLIAEGAFLHTLIDTIPDLIWLKNVDGVYMSCNRRFESYFGVQEKDIVGKTDYDFVDKTLADYSRDHDIKAMAAGKPTISEEWVTYAEDGHRELLETIKTPMYDIRGRLIGVLGIARDITARKAAEEQINSLAFYDSLTHLPNRRLLMDRLKQALASSARNGRKGALLFIDLDNFKAINDTLGHDIGDLLLQQVAQRLESCVREGDTVAHLGGDDFVVMLEDMDEQAIEAAAQTEAVGEKILAIFNQPYRLDTHELHSTSSIGATLFDDHKHSADELMRQADIAMYQAKKAGRNTLRFFDLQMQEAVSTRAAIESELRKALEKKQFKLYYQIQVNDSRHPLGAEALIRWIHPERGVVSPADFIPIAEDSGLILPIGQWVVDTACAQLKAWQQNALTRELVLAVNVSVPQFCQAGFVEQVKAAVQRHAIDPRRLKLELTESLLLENVDATIATMNALKEIGVLFSLDDFGTGYSSLQYLKQLPLHQLKIDQSFVRDITTDNSDKAIVRTVIAMAQSLNLDVIAEGVETEEQRQFLLDKGCVHYQGFLYSRPIPIEEFEELLGRV